MFICISPNPAIDKRIRLPRLVPGEVHRATDILPAPGGKATHVAMVLRALGADPLWIGFQGGASGHDLANGLHDAGIRTEAVTAQQPTRINLEIIDDQGIVTELLEPGGPPTETELSNFLAACERVFAQGKRRAIVILSGSLPPRVPIDFYATLIRLAHVHACKTYLDTSGEPLRAALGAGPDFVKPNRQEAEWLTGQDLSDPQARPDAVRHLLAAGAKSAAISLGADGLLWCPRAGEKVFHANSLKVQVRSTVGCGDSTVAGFAFAAAGDFTAEQSLRLAVACGAANCLANAPGRVNESDIRALQNEVHIDVRP